MSDDLDERNLPTAEVVQSEGRRGWDRPWLPVALTIAFAALLTSRRMVFANDDFPQFQAVRQYGLSRRLLTFNVFQHFAPINRFGHWLAITWSPLNTQLGNVVTLLFLAWFVTSFSLLLGALQVSPIRRAILVVVSGVCVPVIDTMSWFDASMQWLPYLATLTTFLLCHVHFVHRPTVLRALASTAALALCAVADIRFVLAIPLAFLVEVCLIRNGSVSARARAVLRNIPYYVVLAGLSLWAALEIQHKYTLSHPLPRRTSITLTILRDAFTTFYPTRFLGLSPRFPYTTAVSVCVGVALLLVLVVLVRADRRNIGPIVLAVLGLLAPYLLLWKSDLLIAGAITNARRSDYMLPGLLPILLAASKIRLPYHRVFSAARPSSPAVAAGCAMLICALPAIHWVNQGAVFTGLIPDGSSAYFGNLRKYQSIWSDPGHSVVPVQLPSSIFAPRDTQQDNQNFVLTLIDPRYGTGPLGPHRVVIDNRGIPVPAKLLPATTITPASCATQSTRHFEVLSFGHTVEQSPLYLRATVTSDRKVTIQSIPLHGRVQSGPANSMAITPGTHDWILPIGGNAVDHLQVATTDGSAFPCIHRADAIQVATVQPDQQCALIGPDGSPGAVVSCTPTTPRRH